MARELYTRLADADGAAAARSSEKAEVGFVRERCSRSRDGGSAGV